MQKGRPAPGKGKSSTPWLPAPAGSKSQEGDQRGDALLVLIAAFYVLGGHGDYLARPKAISWVESSGLR